MPFNSWENPKVYFAQMGPIFCPFANMHANSRKMIETLLFHFESKKEMPHILWILSWISSIRFHRLYKLFYNFILSRRKFLEEKLDSWIIYESFSELILNLLTLCRQVSMTSFAICSRLSVTCIRAETKLQISSLVITSQTPSHARTRNSSLSESLELKKLK